MIKYINKFNKECYRGVTAETKFDELEFHLLEEAQGSSDSEHVQFVLHTDIGSITVLDRMTGYGYRDVETGYRSPEGEFWLASGNNDVRNSNPKTIGEAILWIQDNANTCRGGIKWGVNHE